MQDSWRHTLKDVFGRALFGTGLHRLFVKDKALVVAFHTIGNQGTGNSIQVSAEQFEAYCKFFKRHFNVVPLRELLDDLKHGNDVSGKLVITFDDGYQDNYTFAAPALERAGLPATFFVTTDFIGSEKIPWWDEQANVQSEWMNWEQVIDLDRRGFDIGSHTMSHANLRFSSDAGITQEVECSKALLEKKLGHPVRHFAYPYGRRSDISDRGRRIIEEAGYDCCLSCFGDYVSPASKAMQLPRVPINDWYGSTYQFGLDALRPFNDPGGEYGQPEVEEENILVVSYHLYPDAAVGARRPSELMRFLKDKGHNVEGLGVMLGKKAAKDPELEKRIADIKVMHVWDPPSVVDWLWKHLKRAVKAISGGSKSGAVAGEAENAAAGEVERSESLTDKLRRHYNALYGLYDARKLWALFAILRLVVNRFSKKYDIVISSGPPSASQLVGYWAAKLNGAKYVMDFRDPWVGNSHVSAQGNSKLRDYFEKAAEQRCVARADLIAVTTPGIERMLNSRYENIAGKIHVIYNGYDGQAIPLPLEAPGRLDMLYAGTLYLNRNPFPLLESVLDLVRNESVDREKVTLTFVGDCYSWRGQSLTEWTEKYDLADVVKILPRVDSKELQALTDKHSILVNLAQGQPDQIPAKTFEYLASGKKMILLAESTSSTAQLVKDLGRVVCIDSDEPPSNVAQLLYELYLDAIGESDRSDRVDDVTGFSRRSQNEQFLGLMYCLKSTEAKS